MGFDPFTILECLLLSPRDMLWTHLRKAIADSSVSRCVYDGERTTAADYLRKAPSNLTIMVNSPAAQILFSDDNSKAVGIKTTDGRNFQARQDVILSLGVSMDTSVTFTEG